MTINSRDKGARGERELAQFVREHGYEARRGQQYHGGGDSPDVITDIPDVHLEGKRVERGNPYLWLAQAIRDAKQGRMPVVAHKRNRKEWIAILRLTDFLKLVKRVEELEAELQLAGDRALEAAELASERFDI